jgi:hypothetical protein
MDPGLAKSMGDTKNSYLRKWSLSGLERHRVTEQTQLTTVPGSAAGEVRIRSEK